MVKQHPYLQLPPQLLQLLAVELKRFAPLFSCGVEAVHLPLQLHLLLPSLLKYSFPQCQDSRLLLQHECSHCICFVEEL